MQEHDLLLCSIDGSSEMIRFTGHTFSGVIGASWLSEQLPDKSDGVVLVFYLDGFRTESAVCRSLKPVLGKGNADWLIPGIEEWTVNLTRMKEVLRLPDWGWCHGGFATPAVVEQEEMTSGIGRHTKSRFRTKVEVQITEESVRTYRNQRLNQGRKSVISQGNQRIYQVFVSSTYEDLKSERLAVTKALLEMGVMPLGMEFFPAASEAPTEVIQKFLQRCDYFIVISAGRYGTICPGTGKSYTEMEVDIAEELDVPILTFLHENPDQIPQAHCEKEPDQQLRLTAFQTRLRAKTCKTFSTPQSLASHVVTAMHHAMKETPRDGWTRPRGEATRVANPLIGTWVLRRGNLPTTNATDSLKLRIFSDNHHVCLWIDPDTMRVHRSFGGEYRYEAGHVPHSLRFQSGTGRFSGAPQEDFHAEVRGNNMRWWGTTTDGVIIDEDWERVTNEWLFTSGLDEIGSGGWDPFYESSWLNPPQTTPTPGGGFDE